MKNEWQSVAGVVYPSYHVALPPLSIMERIWTYSQVTKTLFDKNNIFEPLIGTVFSACIKIDNSVMTVSWDLWKYFLSNWIICGNKIQWHISIFLFSHEGIAVIESHPLPNQGLDLRRFARCVFVDQIDLQNAFVPFPFLTGYGKSGWPCRSSWTSISDAENVKAYWDEFSWMWRVVLR